MEHKAAWKPLTKALKSKRVRNERRKRKRLWLHFTCQWHAAGALLCMCVWACVCVCVCLSLCVYKCVCVCARVCLYAHICACCVCRSCACYAWRHTCSNRVVVDSDSCPVPFTAQSSQPPLCSVRLLMRINVLWRPLGVPHSPPPTARLMKKYNLAKILRWRENDTDIETTRENGKERETKADKTFVNGDMQKKKTKVWEGWGVERRPA